MKSSIFLSIAKKKIVLVLLFINFIFSNWGFFAHKKINRLSVFTIPDTNLFDFYKHHIEYLTEHAVDPDKRRYAVKGEAEKHYIDIDHFIYEKKNPFEIMPKNWRKAIEKFTKDTILKYGVSPWNIQWVLKNLTDAFKVKDLNKILKYSAEIGHYISDVHVPLHSTENYNGQFTNQKGIHGLWESRVPELFFEDYNLITGKAVYIKSPLNYIWSAIEESYNAVDSVLKFEKQLSDEWEQDRKYAYEKRGRVTMQVYSRDFSNAYSKMLDNMQERKIRLSIKSIGSFWYTAWINAGQPNLSDLYKRKYKNKKNKKGKEKIAVRPH